VETKTSGKRAGVSGLLIVKKLATTDEAGRFVLFPCGCVLLASGETTTL
jgi:hypothetical protein